MADGNNIHLDDERAAKLKALADMADMSPEDYAALLIDRDLDQASLRTIDPDPAIDRAIIDRMKRTGEERRGLNCATGFSPATADSALPRPIVFSREALADVERLHDRLFEDNPLAAGRLVEVLSAAFESLGEISDRGRPIDIDGLRELIVPFGGSSYIVRYEPTPERVRVSRVWHGLEKRTP